MATYKVKDPTSGKTVSLTGDAPPTEQELNDVFKSLGGEADRNKDGYWSDTGKHAVEEVKAIPGAIAETGKEVAKGAFGAVKAPSDILSYPAERLSGKQPAETSIAKDFEDVKNLGRMGVENVKETAKSVGRMVSDFPKGIQNEFRERPLGTVGTIASLVIPLAKGSTGGGRAVMRAASSEAPNVVERLGARGVLSSIEIAPRTLERIAGHANPGDVGVTIGKRLVEEKAIGNSATETFKKTRGLQDTYGKSVDKALSDIKKTNKSMGVYPELADPLKVDATPIIKPILDDANALRDSGYPLARQEARYKRAVYNSLAKASENDGFLTIDHVRTEMQKVGKLFKNMAPTSDEYHVVAETYGTLADIRDKMIATISEQAGNPKLADNLLKANEGYSLYTKILPDIRRAASVEATGSTGFFKHPLKATGQLLEAPASKAAVKAGGLPRKLFGGER